MWERYNPFTMMNEEPGESLPSGRLPFLEGNFIDECSRLVGFGEDAISSLQTIADRISSDEELRRFAWNCHYLYCLSNEFPRGNTRDWSMPYEHLGSDTGALYLLVAVSAVPRARAFHESRGIPHCIARDTYADTSLWAREYHEKFGSWGLEPGILPWLYNHLCGDLYRLGRLQFVQRQFRPKVCAFQNRFTKEIKLLSTEGVAFRGDGQIDGTGSEFDPDNGWTTRIGIDGGGITGTPIHPDGFALRDEVTLSLNDWERVVAPGDPILEVHIPAGSPMGCDECIASFREAVEFFPRYFPDRPFRAFCCTSWLLNTQFQEWLPTDSNIVRFQKLFHLFPIHSGGRSGFDRIFGNNVTDFAQAPRRTRLQRVTLDHLQAGGYLRSGGGLRFPDSSLSMEPDTTKRS